VFFVEARYHRNPDKMPQQIRYISHREERLPGGERRELFGIGDRYRALRGDEKAIEKAFADDTRGLRRPAYFRFILTVDNHAAERFARLDGTATERAIRDAVQKTFRGAARDVQGVFAIHQHGGHDRPAHPHVHALLSPRLQNGAPIHFSPRAIERVKQRWEMEVRRGLERQERRLPPTRTPAPANAPDSAAATRVQGKTGGIALRAARCSASAARTPDPRISPVAAVASGGEAGGAKRGCHARTAGSRDGNQPRSRASRSASRTATAVQGAAGLNAERPLARPQCR
jgi:hypothetical protein